MSNKIPKGTHPNTRKQGPPTPGVTPFNRPRQPNNPSNTRGKNASFARRGVPKQIDNIIRTMAGNITALQKENAELKAKLAQAQKNPETQ